VPKIFYRLDSTRLSYQEYWWGSKSPAVVFAWMARLLRVSIPGSMDHPTVGTIAPFEVDEESLPEEVREQFRPYAEELKGLGFHSPIYHAIPLDLSMTKIYWATFLHQSGRACARIHHRIWTAKKASVPDFHHGLSGRRLRCVVGWQAGHAHT
jgi:hypothetical protein